jgi:hypothetical protein
MTSHIVIDLTNDTSADSQADAPADDAPILDTTPIKKLPAEALVSDSDDEDDLQYSDDEEEEEEEEQESESESESEDKEEPPTKRTKSAYIQFVRDRRQQVVAENPGMSFVNIGKTLQNLWEDLSPAEKAKYNF